MKQVLNSISLGLCISGFLVVCSSTGPFVFATAPGSGRGNCIALKEAGQEHSPEALKEKLEKLQFSCVRRDKAGAGTLLVCNKKGADGALIFQAQASGKNEAECRAAVGRLQELQRAISKQNRI